LSMKIAFFGTPAFAVPTLRALVAAGHEVGLVVTNPDRRRGRHSTLIPPDVKVAALELGLTVLQAEKVKEPEVEAALRDFAPELAVVVAYGHFIPRRLRRLPTRGMINVHGSLLPAHRGASPVSQAILDGDPEAGVTIIEVARRMDAGKMLGRAATPIGPEDTTGSLSLRLSELGATCLVETVAALEAGAVAPEVQDEALVSTAQKLSKSDGILDWSQSAAAVDRRIRAMLPWPTAHCRFRRKRLTLLSALPVTGSGEPGEILTVDDQGIVVACGDGALRIAELKPEGKRGMSAADFARGRQLAPGARFEAGA